MSDNQKKFKVPAWIRLLRPAQWLKNGIVPAAWLFAVWDPSQAHAAAGLHGLIQVFGLAVPAFCLVSSAVYVMNDLHDREADRMHPQKRFRPIAAGEVSRGAAIAIMLVLLSVGAIFAAALPKRFGAVLAGYAVMQAAYTFGLKRIPYVDVFVIAFGFVLRAVAGATAISVRISPWLLLCTFLLSLFLALCKRRHEKLLLDDSDALHREALAGYSVNLMDIQIAIAAAATVVSYSIYTLSPETVQRFETHALGLTIPFVIFGVFRYLELVYRHDGGGRPERVMLTDKIMIATVAGYLLTVVAVFTILKGRF